jgi:hypothetical protein
VDRTLQGSAGQRAASITAYGLGQFYKCVNLFSSAHGKLAYRKVEADLSAIQLDMGEGHKQSKIASRTCSSAGDHPHRCSFRSRGRRLNLASWRWKARSGLRSAGICASAKTALAAKIYRFVGFMKRPWKLVTYLFDTNAEESNGFTMTTSTGASNRKQWIWITVFTVVSRRWRSQRQVELAWSPRVSTCRLSEQKSIMPYMHKSSVTWPL